MLSPLGHDPLGLLVAVAHRDTEGAAHAYSELWPLALWRAMRERDRTGSGLSRIQRSMSIGTTSRRPPRLS